MTEINQALLKKFVSLAGDKLTGQWVLLGGTLLPLLGLNQRVTMDIDMAGPMESVQADTIKLMDIAQSLGLPPEAINQAAAYFLFKIEDWHDHIVLLHKGKKATVYRPDATLFVQLKMGRLSEADLADCKVMLSHGIESGEAIDWTRLHVLVDQQAKKKSGLELERMNELRKIIAKQNAR